jgi:hypothetical protein
MGGNDKADALIDVTRKIGAFSATCSWTSFGPVKSPGRTIYDISCGGMQPGGTGKSPSVANW